MNAVGVVSATPWARKLLVTLGFLLGCVAFARFSDYNWPTGTGNLCLVLFLAANVYVPAKRLRMRYRFRGVQGHFSWLLKTHCYMNTAAFVAALIHCYTTSWANTWLWISLVLMGLLTLNGFIMRLRQSPRVRKGLYFLHTQRFVCVGLVYAMLKGHYVFSWLPP